MPTDPLTSAPPAAGEAGFSACVLAFNASDPSGAGGQAADLIASACVGVHALPVMTGAWARDTAQIFEL